MSMVGDITYTFRQRYAVDLAPRRYACAHCDAPKEVEAVACLNCGSRQTKERT